MEPSAKDRVVALCLTILSLRDVVVLIRKVVFILFLLTLKLRTLWLCLAWSPL